MKELPNKQRKLSVKLGVILFSAIALFALAYWIAGNFEGHTVNDDGKKANFWELLYFSVVSITTLGYGDFSPSGVSRVFAGLEAIFGIVFIGYSIAQVLSVRQAALVEYSVSYSIHQTYNECIESITNAKESIGDRRRDIQNNIFPDKMLFIYNQSNPFYPALKALQITNGYSSHLVDIGKIDDLVRHVERAAHHVEELAGFTRKYLNLLKHQNIEWHQDRTIMIILSLCEQIDIFVERFTEKTKYSEEPYKAGGMYRDIVKSLTKDIRSKCKK